MDKHGSPACCGPGRGLDAESVPDSGAFRRVPGPAAPEMVLIPGGVFRMGNEGDYGFAADGEGPVHEVELRPFLLDATTVTNEAFNAFVNATRYRTEAERYGWSFVFAGHLDPREVAARPRVRGSPRAARGEPPMSCQLLPPLPDRCAQRHRAGCRGDAHGVPLRARRRGVRWVRSFTSSGSRVPIGARRTGVLPWPVALNGSFG